MSQFFQYLEKLRAKPHGERRKTILLISLGVTVLIAIVWSVGLSLRINNTDFSPEASELKKETPSITEVFSNFLDQVGEIIDNSATYENQ